MSLFAESFSAVTRHGAYAIKATPDPFITATGTSVAAMVSGDLPWGPVGVVREVDVNEFLQLYAPPGMDRSGHGVLAIEGKAWPSLRILRVVGSGAKEAEVTLQDAGKKDIVTVKARYPGDAGNSIVVTVSDARDGDAHHWNLTVSVSGATGETKLVLQNRNCSGQGDDRLNTPEIQQSVLVGEIKKLANGRPFNGTYVMVGGSSGVLAAGDLTGTAGATDKGIALLEGDPSIRHVFVSYPGQGLLDAVNLALIKHVKQTGDRTVYLHGPPGMTPEDVQAYVQSYRATGAVLVFPWYWKKRFYDDADVLVPGAALAASVASQLPPSTSIAWKAARVQEMILDVRRLELPIGNAAATNTEKGIVTLIRESAGGHSFESAVMTSYPVEPSQGALKIWRMDTYLASSLVQSTRTLIDAPNVEANRNKIWFAVSTFLQQLKDNADPQRSSIDPNLVPHIIDFRLLGERDTNTARTFAEGKVIVGLLVQYSSDISQLFFLLKTGFGPLVKTGGNNP
jgi:phage tail sheath protein FI